MAQVVAHQARNGCRRQGAEMAGDQQIAECGGTGGTIGDHQRERRAYGAGHVGWNAEQPGIEGREAKGWLVTWIPPCQGIMERRRERVEVATRLGKSLVLSWWREAGRADRGAMRWGTKRVAIPKSISVK